MTRGSIFATALILPMFCRPLRGQRGSRVTRNGRAAHASLRSFRHSPVCLRRPRWDWTPADTACDGGLSPGERIGRPLKRRGRKLLWGIVLLLIGFGGTWRPLRPPVDVAGPALGQLPPRRRLPPLYTALERKWSEVERPGRRRLGRAAEGRSLERQLPPPEALARPSSLRPPLLPPLTRPWRRRRRSSPGPCRPRPPTGPVEPLPPPAVDRSDPFQVKAEAVGLHRRARSRVLLQPAVGGGLHATPASPSRRRWPRRPRGRQPSCIPASARPGWRCSGCTSCRAPAPTAAATS